MTTSVAERLLEEQLRSYHIGFTREYAFALPRRFRADFAIAADPILLVEVEGGTWIEGRHVRGSGFASGCEKQALAVIKGYRYIRVTSEQVDDGTALSWIRQAIEGEAA